jgi:hypothetical protein
VDTPLTTLLLVPYDFGVLDEVFCSQRVQLTIDMLEATVNLKSGLLSIVTVLFKGDSKLIDVAAARIGTNIAVK